MTTNDRTFKKINLVYKGLKASASLIFPTVWIEIKKYCVNIDELKKKLNNQ